jgi:hypothetical protein
MFIIAAFFLVAFPIIGALTTIGGAILTSPARRRAPASPRPLFIRFLRSIFVR